jgi:hypothetical protein
LSISDNDPNSKKTIDAVFAAGEKSNMVEHYITVSWDGTKNNTYIDARTWIGDHSPA